MKISNSRRVRKNERSSRRQEFKTQKIDGVKEMMSLHDESQGIDIISDQGQGEVEPESQTNHNPPSAIDILKMAR